jgi:hypothetical protein
MKIIVSESQYRRVIKEDEDKLSHILDRVNKGITKSVYTDWEDYGLENEKEMVNVFKRSFGTFKEYLAQTISYVKDGHYDWFNKIANKSKFTDELLVIVLMDFFYDLMDMNLEGEDFTRNGKYEMWLYFVRDLYGDLISEIYNEINNKDINESEEKMEEDLSPILTELLDKIIVVNNEDVCKVEVTAPWNRKTISGGHYHDYAVKVYFIGGPKTKNWPRTMAVVTKEEDIMGEIWQTVYNFMGLSMDLYSDRVRKCDKINNM